MFDKQPRKAKTEVRGGPKTMIGTRLEPRQWRRLQDFALDEKRSVQSIVVDAVRDYMAARGVNLDD